MPRRSLRFRRGRTRRATAKYVYAKAVRKPTGYTRFRRGLYRKPYNALKWVKMMRHPYGKKSYRWRLKGRAKKRNWKQIFDRYALQPEGVRKIIKRYMGGSARSAGTSW